MKKPNQASLFALMVIAFMGISCGHEPSAKTDANKGRNTNQTPTPTPNVNNVNKDNGGASTGEDEIDTVTIIRTEGGVTQKFKGTSDFVHIDGGAFHSGDLLLVGDASTAVIDCNESTLCSLGKGEYSRCCGDVCQSRIPLAPPDGTEVLAFSKISDLPPEQMHLLQSSESKIRALRANEVTTQFLIATLYSSWKVKEANQEIDKLSQKLNDPQAPQKLDKLYLPMLKKSGDLYRRMDNKSQAEQTYKKVVEQAPQTNDQQVKADAHVSLGEIYKDTGRKEEAVQNLQKGQQLYEQQGNRKKAEDIRKTIVKVQKQ
ncbi:MAG TPA: hypothetical protein DCK93_20475 [Blastocatellia bacterium]|nr:hypothetical protein [Blastocatellia bacterium]